MKAKELNIGDWVQYNGMTCKVYCIESPFERKDERYNYQYIITLWCNGFICAVENEIEPIPLTEEILKTNGFDRAMFDNGNPTDEWIYVSAKEHFHCHFQENHKYWWISTSDAYIHFHYVHELQHALRLCGLNDLADNFKIQTNKIFDKK